jgi:hypothetical protein
MIMVGSQPSFFRWAETKRTDAALKLQNSTLSVGRHFVILFSGCL